MTRAGVRALFLFVLCCLGGLAAGAPSDAAAGEYDVHACDGPNHSWQRYHAARWRTTNACPSRHDARRGLIVATGRRAVAPGSSAGWSFVAPRGTSIAGARFAFAIATGRRNPGPYAIRLVNQRGRELFACGGRRRCRHRHAGAPVSFRVPAGTTRLTWKVACQGGRACSPPAVGRGSLRIAFALVRLRDTIAPRVAAKGSLWSEGWHRGEQYAVVTAADAAGIRSTALTIGGGGGTQVQDVRARCDRTQAVMCRNVPSAVYTFNTGRLSDGFHVVTAQAIDAAGNRRTLARWVGVDNHAPGRVFAAVDGGTGWRSTDRFTVRWANPPGQVAPIARAHLRLCAVADDVCTERSVARPGVDALSDLAVPGPGAYRARVWLEDQAGNQDREAASDPVMLRFDNTVPGVAQPKRLNGWINAGELDEPITLTQPNGGPPSGIAGYSATIDGSTPDGTPETGPDGIYHILRLPEGAVEVKARAVSGAGVPSAAVGSTQLRVDRTDPTVAVHGAPDPEVYQRAPVMFDIVGADQPTLSGMTGAPPDEPVESGGYIAYSLDEGPLRQVRGSTAWITAGDGHHTLAYYAVDVAGNRSAERFATFKVDATAPETAAFEHQDPNDPRRVTARVGDRVSGVAGGTIQIRAAGATDGWRDLATGYRDGALFAYVDDVHLPDGSYELRARVRDRAGNEGFGSQRVDGSPMVLRLPLRIPTQVLVAVAPHTVSTCRRARGRRVCRHRRVRPRLRPTQSLRVGFGRRVALVGRVQSLSGLSVAGAPVRIDEQPLGEHSRRALTTVTADRWGRIAYRAPSGPSRIVRFSYAGTNVLKPSVGRAIATVPARSSLRTNHRVLRNGRSVVFRGRVGGGYIPFGGKLVELQVLARGRWRTFASKTTNGAGRWRYRYRFTATPSTTTYRFRVRVRHEAGYPYALGFSRTVRVTVRG